jgi:enamine deaminase RidA (YjgF/YER057c/UK114 family)
MNLPRTLLTTVLLASLAAALPAAEAPATPEARLAALGAKLPAVGKPIANYVSAVRSGNLVFLAGHIPRDDKGAVMTGKVGRDATVASANQAARQTALGLIATLKSEIGELSRVKRIVRVGGFVNAVDDFKEQPQVMNGCSDLLVAVFGERGKHARAALGVASLPLGAVVEIEMVVEVE